MNDNSKLVDELRKVHAGYADEGPSTFSEAADALEAAQAEIEAQQHRIQSLWMERDAALARLAKLEPKRNVSPPSEKLVLHEMRYHFWEADDDEPADFELFDSGVECDTCIDVALVRQDRLDELIAAAAGASPVQPSQGLQSVADALTIEQLNDKVERLMAVQPAPRRLTEAEITLLVEAYYDDCGMAPPDLIRQVEGLIFGDAQPAHAHAIDTSPERVEKQAGNVQVPEGWKLVPVKPSNAQIHSMAVRYDHGLGVAGYYDGAFVRQEGVTHAMRLECTKRTMLQLYEEAIGEGFYKIPAAPSTKEGA